MTHEFLQRITERIGAILEDDARLSEGLGATPVIATSPRRLDFLSHAIYVFRGGIDGYDYHMGEDGCDFTATWYISCINRRVGDPEALESLVSYLTANVIRIMLDHKSETDYWTSAVLQASDAVPMRGEKDQSFEIETIPIEITWSE